MSACAPVSIFSRSRPDGPNSGGADAVRPGREAAQQTERVGQAAGGEHVQRVRAGGRLRPHNGCQDDSKNRGMSFQVAAIIPRVHSILRVRATAVPRLPGQSSNMLEIFRAPGSDLWRPLGHVRRVLMRSEWRPLPWVEISALTAWPRVSRPISSRKVVHDRGPGQHAEASAGRKPRSIDGMLRVIERLRRSSFSSRSAKHPFSGRHAIANVADLK